MAGHQWPLPHYFDVMLVGAGIEANRFDPYQGNYGPTI